MLQRPHGPLTILKKNLFYNSLLSVSQFIFPLITFPYVSRTLGPDGVGAVNFIDSFTQYFLLFAALGIPVYGIREISKVHHDRALLDRTFTEILTIHVLSTVGFALLYLGAGLLIPQLRLHLDLVLVGMLIMFFSVLTVEWFFVGIEQFAFITKRTLIVRIITIIALFVLLSYKPGALFYYFTFAIVFILNGITNTYYVRRFVTLNFTGLQLKKHLKPLIIILSSALAVSVYVLLDNMILGFMKGEVAVGYYSTAVRIVKIPFAFIGAIAAVMIPQVSRAYHEGKLGDVTILLNKSFTFICIVGLPIVAGLYISSPFVINTFAGGKFSHSIGALQILAPVIILVGINSIFGSQLLAPIGKEKYLLISVVIGMVFSLVVNLLIIPVLSYTGAAITNLCTEVVVTLACYYFARRFVTIRFDYKVFLQCLLGAVMFVPIAFFIRRYSNNYITGEISIIAACVFFYACYLWFVVQNVYVRNIKELVLAKLGLLKG